MKPFELNHTEPDRQGDDVHVVELIGYLDAQTVAYLEEVAQAVLDRIGALNDTFNAFCVVDEERTLADARASEARWQQGQPAGPVDGVPATIKDLMPVS